VSGLLVSIFYLVFWVGCYVYAISKIKPKIRFYFFKRIGLAILIGALPLYIYIYERVTYEVACSTARNFYPSGKVKQSEIFLIYSRSTARLYSKYFSSYVVAPMKDRDWKDESGNYISRVEIAKLKNFVYHKGSEVKEIDTILKQAIPYARYGLFYSEEDVLLTSISGSRYYINDFEQESIISSVESFYKSGSQGNVSFSYLLPYRFSGCGPILGEKHILERTFINWEKN